MAHTTPQWPGIPRQGLSPGGRSLGKRYDCYTFLGTAFNWVCTGNLKYGYTLLGREFIEKFIGSNNSLGKRDDGYLFFGVAFNWDLNDNSFVNDNSFNSYTLLFDKCGCHKGTFIVLAKFGHYKNNVGEYQWNVGCREIPVREA